MDFIFIGEARRRLKRLMRFVAVDFTGVVVVSGMAIFEGERASKGVLDGFESPSTFSP